MEHDLRHGSFLGVKKSEIKICFTSIGLTARIFDTHFYFSSYHNLATMNLKHWESLCQLNLSKLNQSFDKIFFQKKKKKKTKMKYFK